MNYQSTLTLSEALALPGGKNQDGKVQVVGSISTRHTKRGVEFYVALDTKKQLIVSGGGKSEDGETLEEALRRELKEEINADSVNIVRFFGVLPARNPNYVMSTFECQYDEELGNGEPEVFTWWQWLTYEEIVAQPYEFINEHMLAIIKAISEEPR